MEGSPQQITWDWVMQHQCLQFMGNYNAQTPWMKLHNNKEILLEYIQVLEWASRNRLPFDGNSRPNRLKH